MNKDQAREALQGINLTEFARLSRVPLRTLVRIRSGKGSPTLGTLMLLALDIQRIKPRKADGND